MVQNFEQANPGSPGSAAMLRLARGILRSAPSGASGLLLARIQNLYLDDRIPLFSRTKMPTAFIGEKARTIPIVAKQAFRAIARIANKLY